MQLLGVYRDLIFLQYNSRRTVYVQLPTATLLTTVCVVTVQNPLYIFSKISRQRTHEC